MRVTTSNKRSCFLLLGCLALVWSLALPPSAPAQENADAAPLRVGLSTRYPPVAFEKDGGLAGLEVDFARGIGQELGKPVQFESMEFDDLIPALEAGKIDVIMSGMSITAKRGQSIAFAEPYLRVGQMALVRSDDFSRFAAPGSIDVDGARIGFVEGTTGARYVAGHTTKATRVAVDSAEQGVQALRDQKIDVFIHDAPTVWRVSLNPNERQLLALYQPLTEEYLAWAVRKDDPALKGALDGVVKKWKTDGRIDATVNRWIPVRVEVKQ